MEKDGNKKELNAYFHVGKILSESHKQNDLLKEYSIRLANEIGKGYSITNLKYILAQQ